VPGAEAATACLDQSFEPLAQKTEAAACLDCAVADAFLVAEGRTSETVMVAVFGIGGTRCRRPAGRGSVSARSSSARQIFGELLPIGRWLQQVSDRDAEGVGDLLQHIDGDGVDRAFELADIRPVDMRVDGQPLLREAAFDPKPTYVPGEKLAYIHALHEEGSTRINPRRIRT